MADHERYFHICRVTPHTKDSIRISFTNAQVEIEFTIEYLQSYHLLPVGPGDGLYIKGITGNGDYDVRTMQNIQSIRIQRTIYLGTEPKPKEKFRDKLRRLFKIRYKSDH